MPEKNSGKSQNEWDSSVQERLGSIDNSIKELGKRLNDIEAILEKKIKTVRNESLNEIGFLKGTVELMVDELKADSEEKNIKMDAKLETGLNERVMHFEGNIQKIEGVLNDIEQKLFESESEMAVVRDSLESKGIETRIQFLDDQISKTGEVLKKLQTVLTDVESHTPAGLEKKVSELERTFHTTISPTDVTELKMRVENLEKSLGNKDALKKIKALSDKLDEMESRTR